MKEMSFGQEPSKIDSNLQQYVRIHIYLIIFKFLELKSNIR